MQIISQQSLYENRSTRIENRRRRSHPIARLFKRRIVTFLTSVKRWIEAERAARKAIAELAEMDDHMLRDLGLQRNAIESWVRQRPKLGTDDAPPFSNDTCAIHPVLPHSTASSNANSSPFASS